MFNIRPRECKPAPALRREFEREGFTGVFHQHNIARKELLSDGRGKFAGEGSVHHKGATRAFPAGHPSLKETLFAETGRPILLPGNPCAGSVMIVAEPGAEKSALLINSVC